MTSQQNISSKSEKHKETQVDSLLTTGPFYKQSNTTYLSNKSIVSSEILDIIKLKIGEIRDVSSFVRDLNINHTSSYFYNIDLNIEYCNKFLVPTLYIKNIYPHLVMRGTPSTYNNYLTIGFDVEVINKFVSSIEKEYGLKIDLPAINSNKYWVTCETKNTIFYYIKSINNKSVRAVVPQSIYTTINDKVFRAIGSMNMKLKANSIHPLSNTRIGKNEGLSAINWKLSFVVNNLSLMEVSDEVMAPTSVRRTFIDSVVPSERTSQALVDLLESRERNMVREEA